MLKRASRRLVATLFTVLLLPTPLQAGVPNQETALQRLKQARFYRASFANGESRDFEALVNGWQSSNHDARTTSGNLWMNCANSGNSEWPMPQRWSESPNR